MIITLGFAESTFTTVTGSKTSAIREFIDRQTTGVRTSLTFYKGCRESQFVDLADR